MKKLIKKISFPDNTPIRTLMKKINNTINYTDEKAFAIINNKKGECVGTVTDGDLRRYLIKNSIKDRVSKLMSKEFYYVPDYYSKHRVLKEFDMLSNVTNFQIRTLPVLNKFNKAIDIINYSEFFQKKRNTNTLEKFVKKKITVKIPGRLSFAGGGLDFTKLILKNNINILSVSVNRYCKVKIETRNDEKIFIYEGNKLSFRSDIQNVFKIRNLIASTIDFCKIKQGVNIFINSMLPQGSGLGGSSALTIALIYGLKKLQIKNNLNIYNIIDRAFFAERIKFKVHGGWQDFYGTAFGGFKWIILNKYKNKVQSLNIDEKTANKIQKHLIFFKFGHKRSSSSIHKRNLLDNFKDNEIQKMNQISLKLKKLLKKRQILEFFKELNKSWVLKKIINPVSINRKILNAEKISKINGAISYKVLGAGKSGYFMVCAEPKNHKKIIRNLKKLNFKLENIKLEKKGLEIVKS